MRAGSVALEAPWTLRPAADRRARRRGRLLPLVAVGLAVLARSMTGAVAASAPGSPACVPVSSADGRDYLTGRACPPEGFRDALGYEPVLVHTAYGWRYVKPAWAGGSCSGPLTERGPFWDFGAACRTHDYGYDLIRFGAAERDVIDRILYRDMKSSCLRVDLLERGACKLIADTANAVLSVGDATGFDPERLPSAAQT